MNERDDALDGFTKELPRELQTRLDLIIQTIPAFWEQKRYDHFTNHGQSHSERIHRQKLAQLAQELPISQRLNTEEVFIVSAAAWLYETGMQSPNLRPILDFEWQHGSVLTPLQLQEIREKKHLLTEQLIYDSVSDDYQGNHIDLGLTKPKDDYTRLIAEVCRWCSGEPLDQVPEKLPIKGIPIRVRLLVALLRLADQLYIDNSRVTPDLLLERSKLPQRQFARWWAFQYAQTLPIVNGQIRFHYFMPESQKEYLGHIRALIEPNFDIDQNPTIQYLWDKHQLRLMPQKIPTARFDRQTGFQRLMSRDLLWFLRQEVTPKETPTEVPIDETLIEKSLLVLDYENFILQLGLEGHFLTIEEVGQAVISILKEACDQHPGPVDALAIGHWDRPDLSQVSQVLKENVYELLIVKQQDLLADKFSEEIRNRVSAKNPPKQITVVAPSKVLAGLLKDLADKGQPISAWITGLPEARIYQAVVNKCRFLKSILSFPDKNGMDARELEFLQIACILRLDNELSRGKGYLPFDKVNKLLNQLDEVSGHGDWWTIWLLNHGVFNLYNNTDLALNPDNLDVLRARRMQKAVIKSIQELPQDEGGVRQDILSNKLSRDDDFPREEILVKFLELLKHDEILMRLPPSVQTENQVVWQLNPLSLGAVTANIDQYMARFILALDHLLLREGFRTIHEHTLLRKVKPYFPEAIAHLIYNLALGDGWVERHDTGEKFHGSNNPIWGIKPAEQNHKVAAILRNRDILLTILYKLHKTGVIQETLWLELSKIKSFTLVREIFDLWINFLIDDEILIAGTSDGHTTIKLDVAQKLTQWLLGRIYICGLVTTFRIRGATRSDAKRPERDMINALAQFVTHHNTQMAEWTIAYAKNIKLVKEEANMLYLNSHSLPLNLDRREGENCQAILSMVKKLGAGNWVSQNAIYQEMEKDIRFGYSRGEHEYWLNTTIHRRKLLEEKKEEQRNSIARFVKPVTR